MFNIAKRKSVFVVFFAVLILMMSSVSVYAATVGQPLTSPEAGWQRIDDVNSGIKYSGSGWVQGSDSRCYQGSQHGSNVSGDTVSIKFYGEKLQVLSSTYNNNPSNIKITVDGTDYQYSEAGTSTMKYQVLLFEKLNLMPGVHTVVISSPSSSLYTGLDCIDIDDTGYLIDWNQPLNLTATTGDTLVGLSWDAVTDATSYKVYRSITTGGPYTEIASQTTNYYTDTSVTNGTTYYYVVTAVTSEGESSNSNEVSATPSAQEAIGNALLVITMANGLEKEYDMNMSNVNAFISWYDGRAAGTGSNYYIISKNFNLGPFLSRTDYIVFDKIMNFEVNQY